MDNIMSRGSNFHILACLFSHPSCELFSICLWNLWNVQERKSTATMTQQVNCRLMKRRRHQPSLCQKWLWKSTKNCWQVKRLWEVCWKKINHYSTEMNFDYFANFLEVLRIESGSNNARESVKRAKQRVQKQVRLSSSNPRVPMGAQSEGSKHGIHLAWIQSQDERWP